MADKKNTENGAAEKKETPKVDIIRGRMPLLIVHMIKFGNSEATDGSLATKFRTTNGKVSDIRKNRNFGYITEDFAPTKEMKEQALEYAEQLEDKSVATAVKKVKVATEDQAKAFEEARKASRPGRKKKEEAPAEGKTSDEELEGLTE